jgi:hypothetical protein
VYIARRYKQPYHRIASWPLNSNKFDHCTETHYEQWPLANDELDKH